MEHTPDDGSPLSSVVSSDSEDDVNSATAKTFFGPHLSPEKKFAPIVRRRRTLDPPDAQTPNKSGTWRSSWLSIEPLSGGDEQDAEEEERTPGPSKRTAHDHDNFQDDDPPSALAQRIMRAHDNPSPPPKALRLRSPLKPSGLVKELVFPVVEDSELPTKSYNAAHVSDSEPEMERESASEPRVQPEAIPTLPSLTLREPSPPPHLVGNSPATRNNLISFDESVILSRSPGQVLTPPHVTNGAIDALLCASSPYPPAMDIGQGIVPSPPPNSRTVADISSLSIQDGALQPITPPRRRSPRLSFSPHLHAPVPIRTSLNFLSPISATLKRKRDGTSDSRKGPEKSADAPSKIVTHILLDGEHEPTDIERTPHSADRRRGKKRAKLDIRASDTDQFELAQSLSPESARVLTTLMTPRSPAAAPECNTSQVITESIERTTSKPAANIQRPPPGSQNPYIGSLAGNSQKPSGLPFSWTHDKSTLADPNRTPARRVPISESPYRPRFHVGLTGSVVRTPVFARPTHNDPKRSPAKRVLIADVMAARRVDHNLTRGMLSPTPSRSRSTSAEPAAHSASKGDRKDTLSAPNAFPEGSGSKEPSGVALAIRNDQITEMEKAFDGDHPGSRSRTPPLLEPQRSSPPPTLPVPTDQPKDADVLVRPKAGFSDTNSRIPRMGSVTSSNGQPYKLPVPPTRKTFTFTSSLQPSRLPSPVKPTIKPTIVLPRRTFGAKNKATSTSSSGSGDSSSGESSATVTAKRKRLADQVSSPRQPSAVVKPAVPTPFGSFSMTQQPPLNSERKRVSTLAKPMRSQRSVMARKFVSKTVPGFDLETGPSGRLQASLNRSKPQASQSDDPMDVDYEAVNPNRNLEPTSSVPPSSQPQPESDSHSGKPKSLEPIGDVEGLAAERLQSTQTDSQSTRPRRAVTTNTDVFGPFPPTSVSLSSRRKPRSGGAKSTDNSVSALPMSAVALKTLTTANTTRNQQYQTTVETLIVRKSGDRPESPSMKLRTVLQKQKEEQGKDRAERARRRRGEGSGVRDFSLDDSQSGYQTTKHARGAGDDEEFTTPERPDDCGKRVKWDRGLASVVCLDKIKVRPNNRHREAETTDIARRSCLVQQVKSLPLDPLGNLLRAESPLDLGDSKVVVTKFVYDNDHEPEVIVVKQTRSKSKRNR